MAGTPARQGAGLLKAALFAVEWGARPGPWPDLAGWSQVPAIQGAARP